MNFGKLFKQSGFFLNKAAIPLVFVVSLLLFTFLQAPNKLADPDSFYHTKLTVMLRDYGVVREFPWTQESLYKNIFIDHHLGYHIIILPFLSLFNNSLLGLQFITALLAAFTITSIVWCLKKWQVPYWGIGVLLLLTSSPLLFRLSLGKAPSLGVGLAVIGYYLISERKNNWLFWFAWFYAWVYSAWLMLVVMAGVIIISDWVIEKWRDKKTSSNLLGKKNIITMASILGGLVLGITTNPYFPINIKYLLQIFKMALVPYYKIVGIGTEWYPPVAVDFPAHTAYPLLVWLLLTMVGVFIWRKISKLTVSAWLITILWLVYTFRARRQVEYLVPWFILSSGLLARDWLIISNIKIWWDQIKNFIPKFVFVPIVKYSLFIYLIILVPVELGRGIVKTKTNLDSGINHNYFKTTGEWLKNNTEARSIVFQSNWGSFPELWYYNDQNWYLTGLDQTFMYEYSADKYKLWQEIVDGKKADFYNEVKNIFKADYYLLEKKSAAALGRLNRDTRFIKVHQNEEAIIYKVE
ncbi:MAG: hypothetical protein AAB657_02620 [Patescibacteria group bacterium]